MTEQWIAGAEHTRRAAVAIIHVMLVAQLWGDWRQLAFLVIFGAVIAPANLAMISAARDSRDVRDIGCLDDARNLLNATAVAIAGHALGWPLPIWLLLLVNAFWLDNSGQGSRLKLLAFTSLVAATALRDGVAPMTVLCCSTGAGVVFAFTETRVRILARAACDLATARELLAEAQAVGGLGSWTWDLRTNHQTWSHELYRIVDAPRDQEPSFDRLLAAVHPDDRELVKNDLKVVLDLGVASECEHRIVRADGTVRWIHARRAVIRDDHGAAVRLIGSSQDITERKELQSRILLADRLASLGTLASGVAHEINNPLSYVISNLQYLREQHQAAGAAGDETLEILDEASAGAERVRQIVRDLKTFGRGDDDKRGPVDLHEVLELSIKMAHNEIRHRARLVRDFAPVPPVHGNAVRLGQVCLNLLVNAAHAITEGCTDENAITVTTGVDAIGRPYVEVRDTGCGIAAQHLSRVFTPFFTTKPVGVGTGLGLPICHGIINELGGEITIDSAVGCGTAVRVALRPAAELTPALGADSARPSVLPQAPRRRVLIIDDEPRVARGLARMLGSEHDVEIRTSGAAALADLQRGDLFDAIVCDVMMPETSGPDVYAELCAFAPEMARRIVFITGGAFTPQARAFVANSPTTCLEKPINAANLRQTVRQVVEVDATTDGRPC